ncbi:hypothetical protein AB0395_39725 [Streptosporangium sp. NPDC051023]|uniref:phage tail tube protein n=1 Tax=Streptosporangium sp. NPDC051023 TaxID=3155410 RepID=UPI00344EC944
MIMPTILRAAELAVVGSNGGGWVATLGTAQPANPQTYPLAPWYALGAISDDGLTYGFDEDSQDFTPWGQSSPFRTVVTKSVRTFKITLWETNRPAARSVMTRIPIADLTPDINGVTSYAESATQSPDRRSWIFDVYDGDALERFYVPAGEVTDRGDVTFKQDEMSGYEVTISAYPDASGNTVYHKLITPEVEVPLS